MDQKALVSWAASDPARDPEVAKIDASKFYNYMLMNPNEFSKIIGHKGVVRAITYLKIHAGKSHTRHVVWTKVFARLYIQNLVGISVKRVSGLSSLVYWLLRNAGIGVPVRPFCQWRLIAFILANRYVLWEYIHQRRQKKIIRMMKDLSIKTECRKVNWDHVIPFLVRKRHLFN